MGRQSASFLKELDHIKLNKKRKMDTAISRHVGIYHEFNPHFIRFLALEHVPLDSRGVSVDRILLQLEARWIYDLKATIFPGFNESLSFKPFLPLHSMFTFRVALSLVLFSCSPLSPPLVNCTSYLKLNINFYIHIHTYTQCSFLFVYLRLHSYT